MLSTIPEIKGVTSQDCYKAAVIFSSAIKRLKRHKAPGPDGLPIVVFKLFNNSLVSHLTALYNSILSNESFPEAWSLGSIKPIHKKGDKSNPSNYRSITLLNVTGKIFTSILRDRISDWAEANGILNESQFGFRETGEQQMLFSS